MLRLQINIQAVGYFLFHNAIMSSYEILLTKVKLPAVRSLLEVAHASEHPHGVIVDHSGVMVLGRDLTRPLARPLTLGHQVPGLGGKVERP